MQEIASIMKYITEKSNDITVYYNNIPEGFLVPSVYFSVPENNTHGDTLNTYTLSYNMNVMFFHKTSNEAHTIALSVLTAIKRDRNFIKFIDIDGMKLNEGIKINDPKIDLVDNGAVKLSISFDCRKAI